MNVRHRWLGLLACVALQACTTPPPPAPAAPPPPAVTAPPPVVTAPPPMPAPSAVPGASAPMPAPAPVAQARPEPVVDIRAVCDGRAEGERLQTRGPGGETLSGVCLRGANGWLKFSTNGRR